MPNSDLTVFVVDDDEDIRTSLSRALAKRGYQVETHSSAASFLAAWHAGRAGCVVLDYGMPGMNGLELQRHMIAEDIPLPIIFVSGHGGVPESVQAIKGGAIDFLEKPFRQADLLERIETALSLARDTHLSRRIALQHREKLGRLTARELEIAEYIISNPAATSSKEIAAHLGISPRTVDHHRARILEKLELRSVTELIVWGRGSGG